MAIISLSFHPFTPIPTFILEIQIIILIIGFTSPNSRIRTAALTLVAACAYNIVLTSHKHMRAHWASLLAGTSVGFLLQYIELSLLSKWSFQSGGPTSQHASLKHERTKEDRVNQMNRALDRLYFGFSSTFSFRHVDTKWEVKNVPPFSVDPAYTPSRSVFLFRSTATALTCYILLDASSALPTPENNSELFSWEVVPIFRRLGDVTTPQLTLRLGATFLYWVNMYCIMQGVTSTVSVVAVALRLTEVRIWRPLFGSPLEAYTLRRFWR